MYKAIVTVKLRPSILDPEGKAIEHAITSLGFSALRNVRVGKHIELHVDAASEEAARPMVDEACRKLFSNPVMEDYTFTLEEM